jgi:hypothetical protein
MMEEAVELLTRIASGERRLDGSCPSDSVFGRAAQRLEEMAQAVAEWSEGGRETERAYHYGAVMNPSMRALI